MNLVQNSFIKHFFGSEFSILDGGLNVSTSHLDSVLAGISLWHIIIYYSVPFFQINPLLFIIKCYKKLIVLKYDFP